MDALQREKPKPHHKRSKKGCLTCRSKRKKCPEDYRKRSDGSWTCSVCEIRDQACKLPLMTRRGSLIQRGANRYNEQQQERESSTTPQSVKPIFSRSEGRSNDPSSVAYTATLSTSPFSTSKDSPFASNHVIMNGATLPPTSVPLPAVVSAGVFDRNDGWLDTFLDEFITLTEPILQNVSRPSFASSSTSSTNVDALTLGISPQSNSVNEAGAVIDRMIQSENLDDLLTKWAQVYNTFLCAIIDTSKVAGDTSLIDHLMEITRSDNICKASMVSCCLAYSDVIDRELKSPRGPSRFVKYLLKGNQKMTQPSKKSSTFPTRQTNAWLKYAREGFHRSKMTMDLAPKLLTLLNLRFASVCYLGAKEAFALAGDIHSALSHLGIDMQYLHSTAKKGSPLSLIVQALSFANIMDAATMRGVRPAVLDKSVNMETALELDLAIHPRADFKTVTILSIDLIGCLKRISDLAADIAEGQLRDPAKIEAKSEQIKELIMKSEVDMPTDICQATSRVRNFLLHELWIQALLIQLYQDVLRLGPMAVRVQQALQNIVRLAELLEKTEEKNVAHIDVWDMSFVWFLACSVSISREHREFCLSNLENLGCERAILDTVEAVKILWKTLDDTGQSTEWREVLRNHGLVISYTF